jgi:hypothetical protein
VQFGVALNRHAYAPHDITLARRLGGDVNQEEIEECSEYGRLVAIPEQEERSGMVPEDV